MKDNKELVILAGKGGPGGGVSSVNGQTGTVVLDYEDVGAAQAETVETVSDAAATIFPEANHVYNCGEITSLTISGTLPTGPYVIRFTSGATATTTSIPADIIFLEPFAPAANTYYEINVDNNHAVAVGWPTT